MTVGILRVEIYIPGVRSLKEKRKVVKSLKDKIRHHYNVSVAEVDYSDKWQRSVIAVAQIGNDNAYIGKNLDTIYRWLTESYEIQVIDKLIEFF